MPAVLLIGGVVVGTSDCRGDMSVNERHEKPTLDPLTLIGKKVEAVLYSPEPDKEFCGLTFVINGWQYSVVAYDDIKWSNGPNHHLELKIE